jgi:sec-independent protein translocase protein TatC
MDVPISFWDHIEELRKTLIRVLLIAGIGMFCSFIFYKPLFSLLTSPIDHAIIENTKFKIEKQQRTRITNINSRLLSYRIPENSGALSFSSGQIKELDHHNYLIPPGEFLDFDQPELGRNLLILSPPEGLMIAFKTSFWVGLVGTSPLWMFFILRYIAPALHSHERRMILPFLFFSLLFLTLGFLFAFFITIPTANTYLTAFNQGLGLNLWTLSHYLDYTLILLLANALAFELFAILLILVHYGWISAKGMAANRKFVFIGFLILSALLTPPDVLTQLMLALPLTGFYEATILYARLRQRALNLKRPAE